MARPQKSADERRDRVLPPIRASRAELAAIEARRAASGLSMSAYVRQQAMNGAIIQRESIADKRLLLSLGAVGNNLNQLSRRANIQGEIDPVLADQLREALTQVQALMGSLMHDS